MTNARPHDPVDSDALVFFLYAPSADFKFNPLVDRLSKSADEYVWHYQRPHFRVVDGAKTCFLLGQLRFGDGIEDEWHCVRMLLDLTSSPEFSGIVATIFDADGDFMLIEAAQVLPEWLEPTTSRNRLFLYEGHVHLVDQSLAKHCLRLDDALSLVRTRSELTRLAGFEIEQVIRHRLDIPQHFHCSRVKIPLQAAKVLKLSPSLLGLSLGTFYERDPELMKVCTEMKYFNPNKQGGPLVDTTIRFTRLQFAQLACQEFLAPFNQNVNFEMTASTASELGMKLACALEMYHAANNETPKDAVLDDVICNDPEDDLQWMEVDFNDLDRELKSAFTFDNINDLDDTNAGAHVENPDEFESIIEKMKSLLTQKSSSFEGIDATRLESSGSADDTESESDDDCFIEKEIFEAIHYDPDLLMKILEANEKAGENNQLFLQKFKQFQSKQDATSSVLPKKGLADIDPVKLEDARKSNRTREPNASECQGSGPESSTESSSDEDIYHDPCALDQVKKSFKCAPDDMSFEDVMSVMDAELQDKSPDRCNMNEDLLPQRIAESLLSAASSAEANQPLATIFSSLGHQLPRPGK